MDKLLTGDPIILEQDKDLLGNLEKTKLIKQFFEAKETYIAEEKMLALYGDWGSGKSSLMKTLINGENSYKLNREKYKPLLFEAWKYESDDNLAYSLFEFIAEEISPTWKSQAKEKVKEVYIAIKGFSKGIKFNFGLVSVSGERALTDLEKLEEKRIEEESLYKKKTNFEKAFNDLLENEEKKLVIFIDDLDRCEAENILNLLSAIKLFFSLGKNIIFVCGIDKKAVNKALMYKYGNDIQKAEEYLEKIFSFSFSMPKSPNLNKLLSYYFGDNIDNNFISKFLYYINFLNARHLTKVLNKYSFIASIKKKGISNYGNLIPCIITDKSDDKNI